MIGMKARYEVADVSLKISNVNPREQESYVLLTASDDNDNEIVFALSHQQAEHLEDELFEANRRWKTTASSQDGQNETDELTFGQNEDKFSH